MRHLKKAVRLFCVDSTKLQTQHPRAFLRHFLRLPHVPLQLGEAAGQREEARMGMRMRVIASPALETFVLY